MTSPDQSPLVKRGVKSRLVAMVLAFDLVSITLGHLIVYNYHLEPLFYGELLGFVAVLLFLYMAVALRSDAYRPSTMIRRTASVASASVSLLMALLLSISLAYAVRATGELSRVFTIGGTMLGMGFLVLMRFLFAERAHRALDGSPESEVVLVDGAAPPEACNAFRIDLRQLGLAPGIDDPGMLDRLGHIIREADRVIVTCAPERRAQWAVALKGAGVDVEVMAPELDAIGAITRRRYHGIPTTLIATGPLNAVDRVTKRAFDLAIAVPAVVVLGPVMLAIALAVRYDSPGRALFIQQRIGMGNRLFPMYKFRSMRSDRGDATGSVLTTRNDDRVTRIGNFLRRTSLDELPQLLNVLRGDMSIVGPRPHATGALAGSSLYWEVTAQYWGRHAVKPGLTGLAQVRGFRGNTETDDDLLNRVQADLEYLDSWSIWQDVVLVIQTFRVLVHRNAF